MKNKKGFTLAELLIVVAIIGILVAISLPVFNQQLKKARLATNQSNARAAVAAAKADWLLTQSGYGSSPSYGALYHAIYDVNTATLYPGEGSAGEDPADGGPLHDDIENWTIDTREHSNPKMGDKVFKQWAVVIKWENEAGDIEVWLGCSTEPFVH
jgi:prepilin-type N-terminal cleavage/methylation domain-containing protein